MPPAQERHEQPRELLSLPDDVLVRCLEPLSQEERCVGVCAAPRLLPAAAATFPPPCCRPYADTLPHTVDTLPPPCRFRDVALVCKRLRALCRAPELLRQVTVTLRDAPGLPHQARLVSLRGFLEAAGQHIGGLRLDVPSDIGLADDATVCVEAWSEVGAPCLRDLSVTAPLTGRTDWLLAMTGLTRLELRCHSDTLHLPRGFSQLTALASAGLWGAPFVLDVPLPRGLTALSFLTNLALPNQVGAQRLCRAAWLGACCALQSPAAADPTPPPCAPWPPCSCRS